MLGRGFDLLKNVKVKVSQVGIPMSVVGGLSKTPVRPLAAFRVYIEDQSSAVNVGLVQFLNSVFSKIQNIEQPNYGPPGLVWVNNRRSNKVIGNQDRGAPRTSKTGRARSVLESR